jgi:hypothetical protein
MPIALVPSYAIIGMESSRDSAGISMVTGEESPLEHPKAINTIASDANAIRIILISTTSRQFNIMNTASIQRKITLEL